VSKAHGPWWLPGGSFVGATGFTGPGQVSFAIEIDPGMFSGRTTVFASIDADTAPEFILTIPSPFTIPIGVTAADFVL
jgi:hypothetical protein